MIAHDSHPWSIVSDTGFLKLLKVLESLCNKKFISCWNYALAIMQAR